MNFRDYYQSYNNYFWQWEENGDVLSIPGGSTIGFKAQVAEMLTGIAENGLPPFGSVLLAIIATNKTMDDAVAKTETLLTASLQSRQKHNWVNEEAFTEAFDFLRLLQTIAPEYKTGRRRQILLQCIFSESHNRCNTPTSKGIAAALLNKAGRNDRFLTPRDFNETILLKELRVVGLLKRTFPTPQSVVDAMGALPPLEEEDIPLLENFTVTATTYEDFVEELLHNPNTFETAALIKPIWAGFHIPIFNAHPSEQPLGGVSDLSNKGDFDKLLISEFANDDILFMNRVANNEALYLHREMPPVKDNLHRTVLMDVSLKSWGTPKILSFAAYIAIARHPKALTETRAFVLGDAYTPVSCNSTGEIIDALQQTDAALHPGKGLAIFLEHNRHDKELEIFYITTSAALKYPAVQKQLASYQSLFKYIITTEAEGAIHFYRNKKAGLQHLQTIQLPLEKLWSQRPATNLLPPVTVTAAAVQVPILLPFPGDIRKVLPLDSAETYYVAHKCLFRQRQPDNPKKNTGLELVLRNIPANSLYEVGKLKNGQVQFLSFNLQRKEVSITRLDTLQNARCSFNQWNGKLFREFLFDRFHDAFIYLFVNPDGQKLEPDFNSGIIKTVPLKLTSNKFGVDYSRRQEEIRLYPDRYADVAILKNVSSVFINADNYLIINDTHQLHINDNEQAVFFSSNINLYQKITTLRSGNKKEFVFSDGSKVIIDVCGYIQLLSSNPAIPEIFISSTPKALPAMATSREFAGNDMYFNEALGSVKVRVEATGNEIIHCIKIVRAHCTSGLQELKETFDSAPAFLPGFFHPDDAALMITQLAKHGCKAVIEKNKQPHQVIVSAKKFYLENIATFIGHIINHAPAG